MIGKVVKPGNGFRGVVSYLMRGKRESAEKAHRVQWTLMRNMLIDDIELAPSLMRATASKSKRVKNPVYHYVISWPKAFTPTEDMMQQVADVTCVDLGLEDYQRLYVGHDDTAHRHVHIVVNRVHPETGVAWRMSKDYEKIELSLRRQAEGYGIEFVPGRHNTKDFDTRKARRPRDGEYRMAGKERGVGGAAPGRWSRERIQDERQRLTSMVQMSDSWETLQSHLAGIGMSIDRKGQGIVISDFEGSMKLSELGKQIRLPALEQQYGGSFRAFDDARAGLERQRPRQREEKSPPRPRERPVEKKEATRARSQPDQPSELRQRWAAFSIANDHVEMSLILFRMGFISRTDLDRSFMDQETAKHLVDRSRSFLDKLSHIDWRNRQRDVDKARKLRNKRPLNIAKKRDRER